MGNGDYDHFKRSLEPLRSPVGQKEPEIEASDGAVTIEIRDPWTTEFEKEDPEILSVDPAVPIEVGGDAHSEGEDLGLPAVLGLNLTHGPECLVIGWIDGAIEVVAPPLKIVAVVRTRLTSNRFPTDRHRPLGIFEEPARRSRPRGD